MDWHDEDIGFSITAHPDGRWRVRYTRIDGSVLFEYVAGTEEIRRMGETALAVIR